MADTAKAKAARAGAKAPADRKPKQQPPDPSAEDEFRIAFAVDGRDYVITPGDLTAVESRAFKREMGRGLIATFADGDYELEELATLMWLMDRRDDPSLSWEDVASKITLADIRQVEVEGDEAPSG